MALSDINRISEKVYNESEKIDNWSNETIKNSTPGKISGFIYKIFNLMLNDTAKGILFKLFILSIYGLLVSLILPQFADDRFGIGLIIGFCGFLFLINLFVKNIPKIHFNSTDIFVLIFTLIAIASTFHSYFFHESINGLMKLFTFISVYFILKLMLLNSSTKTILNFYRFLFVCALITSLYGLYQYFIGAEQLATWQDPGSENIFTRVYSTLVNPNLLAGYLLIILPVSLTIPFASKSSLPVKILFITGCLIIFACIILTGSRGAYIGAFITFATGSLVFIIYLNKKFKINFKTLLLFTISALIIIYLALTILFPQVTERVSTIFTLREHTSNNFRMNVWMSCVKMLKDNWLTGIGPGNKTFLQTYGLYMVSGFDALGSYNIFLEFWIEFGIFGFLCFLLILLTSFLKLHYIFWLKNSFLAYGIFLSLIAAVSHGMFDTVFFRAQVYIPFWLLIASIGKLEGRDECRGL